MLFVDENKNQYKEFLEFGKASLDLQGKVTMAVAELTNAYANSIARHYSIDTAKLPLMMLFH